MDELGTLSNAGDDTRWIQRIRPRWIHLRTLRPALLVLLAFPARLSFATTDHVTPVLAPPSVVQALTIVSPEATPELAPSEASATVAVPVATVAPVAARPAPKVARKPARKASRPSSKAAEPVAAPSDALSDGLLVDAALAAPFEEVVDVLTGRASYYGDEFAGRRTASGERFDPDGLTAAHKSLPFGTRLRVTNLRNGKSVVVRVNDRGPYAHGRVLDLSYGSARQIRMTGAGEAPVRIEVLR